MAWLTLTPDHLKEYLAGAEYDSITAAALNTGQDAETLVENALARVAATVRGYVGRKNQLGSAGTIPDELQDAALAIATVNILKRLPGMDALISKPRTAAANDAMRMLRDCASGDFVIVAPTTPASDPEQPQAGKIATVKKHVPRYNRENLSRL